MRLPPAIVALTPGTLAEPRELAGVLRSVEAAVDGGLRGVLVREPRLADGVLGTLLERVRETLAAVGGWLGVHDRVHLAQGDEAVHLGFRSLPPYAARACGATTVGLSTHAGDAPTTWAGVDYRFLGPVHATPSKEGWLEPLGVEAFARAAEESEPPVWAIGGIDAGRVAPLRAAGAAGAAVRRGILQAPDPAAAAAAHLEAWGNP